MRQKLGNFMADLQLYGLTALGFIAIVDAFITNLVTHFITALTFLAIAVVCLTFRNR